MEEHIIDHSELFDESGEPLPPEDDTFKDKIVCGLATHPDEDTIELTVLRPKVQSVRILKSDVQLVVNCLNGNLNRPTPAEKLVYEFIPTCCVSVPTLGVKFSDLYKAYILWHEDNHADKQILKKRKFFVALKRRYCTDKMAGQVYINNLLWRKRRHQPQP